MRKRNNVSSILFLILFVLAAGAAMQVKAVPGDLDTTFGAGGVYTDTIPITTTGSGQNTNFTDSKLLADGSLINFGTYSDYGAQNYDGYGFDFYLQKLRPNGTLDPTFGTGGTKRIHLWEGRNVSTKMKILPNNKILLAGRCFIVTGFNTPQLSTSGFGLCAMQLMPDGSLDTSFGGNSVSVTNPPPPAGDGSTFSYTTPPGTVFYDSGKRGNDGQPEGAYAVDTTADGDIVLAGRAIVLNPPTYTDTYYAEVLRLSSSGAFISRARVSDAIDPAGSARFERQFNAIGVLSNGKVIAVGYSQNSADQSGYPSRFLMARIAIDGSVETTYENSEVNAQANALSVTFTRSNKILVGGEFGYFGGNGGDRPRLYRFNGDFTPDTTFGTNGVVSYCRAGDGAVCPDKFASYSGEQSMIVAAIQPDGKILALMGSHNPNSGSNFIARLNPDGSYDRSFGKPYGNNIFFQGYVELYNVTGGQSSTSVNVRPNGKIITTGQIYNQSKASAAQLLNTFKSGIYSDFNDDGKSEISVYRPTDGVWHYLDSFNGNYTPVQFGLNGDKLAPADYDGDGKTDRAVFRSGTWYILQSSNSQVRYAQFGIAGDLPRPGDFNGDGYADIAVFRPSNGTWYIQYSNPIQPGNITNSTVQFGQNGDVPLLADFDGDGKSDISVFRNGVWYFIRSSDLSIGIVQFGLAGDVPVAGDYDGDGKTDIAVFRNNLWYVLRSSDNGVSYINWGTAGDKPVPGDYDNDGKTDAAIYRNGIWWILQSSDNQYKITNFGLSSDLPIQAAYLP